MQEEFLPEDTEAALVEHIRKYGDVDFGQRADQRARVVLRDALLEKGMPREHINDFIGRMYVDVDEAFYDTPVFHASVETSASHIFSLYSFYMKEFSFQAFRDAAIDIRFSVGFTILPE